MITPRSILVLILALISVGAQASAIRTIDADVLRASGGGTSIALPAATGTAMVSVGVFQVTPSGAVSGSNTNFSIAFAPNSFSTFQLYLDGILLIQGTDYTLSGSVFTMTTAPALGQSLIAIYSRY